jgi:serine/threonine protein kinase
MEATPRTKSIGGGGGYSPTRSAPKEVQDAAKDPKRIFGKYVLVKELGRGGAGVVYKAWDTTLAQYVALKFIRDQDLSESSSTGGSQAVEDFQREARMSAKLRHPNIIRIYELGCMSNRYYLSMDYIEGGSLFEVIHDGKERNTDTVYNSAPKKYLEMMRKIIEAVHAAHSHAPPVIHRDLKPHNVLVDKSDVPFVVDFGLAKEVEISTSQHTMTGVVKGTPSYMAPEQAEGRNKDVDARTDVYSLGAILYELLTGRPPFVGGSVREVLNAICTQLPERPNMAILKAQIEKANGTHRPRPVPKPLETICMKALEKAKEDRYPTAKDFADDIGRFLNDEDILAQEPGLYRRIRRKVRQHPLLSGGIAAAVLCAGVIVGALHYASKRAGGNDQLVAIAREHLSASNWGALGTDVENLRKVDPKHPLIAEIEGAMKAHAAELARKRAEWAAGLARLPQENLLLVLDALRSPFRSSGELRPEFADRLERALLAIQDSAETEARDLAAGGPGEAWLDGKTKASARACRERISQLQGLAADAEFPFKAAAALGGLRDGLDRLLAWEGLWELRVNVAPFARVTIRKGGAVVAEEWTPVGVRGLEVAGEYRVELAWTPPGGEERKVGLDLRELKHGQRLVLTGDMTKADVKVAR